MADQEDEINSSDLEAKTPEPDDSVKQTTTNTDAKPENEPTRVRKQKSKPVQIDLSKVKTKIQPHNKPSLPTPLTEYGLDEKKQARAKARAGREPKEKRQKKSTSFYGEDERDREKERLKDERYMQVLEDLKTLRNYYYSEYRDMLDTKVEQQRKDIRSKTEAQQKRRQSQEDKEREASHRVKKRHDHHKLQHDENYLKNVPKSDVYMILGLQEKMVKEGKLRCQDDLDRFWMEMRKPDIFFSHFPNGLAATSSIHHKIASSASRPPLEDSMGRSLNQIVESKESSRPTTHDTWAVTQRFHHIHQPTDSQQSFHKSPSLSPSKQAALELERRFPKLEMPELHCFTMDLGEKPPDPEEIRMKLDLKVREKQRRRFLKKLHKMHQLAMANSAAATRILDKHTDLAFLMEGPQLTDLISDYYWEDSRPVPQSAPARDRLPPLPESDSRGRGRGVGASREKTGTRPASEATRKRAEPSPVEKQLVVYEPPKPLPLTMEEVKGKNRILEAKILSSFWTNYMHAGKNVFLTSSS